MDNKDNNTPSAQVKLEKQARDNNIPLDFNLKTHEERVKLVEKIIEITPSKNLNQQYLNILSDYIVLPITKQEKKDKVILTKNRENRMTVRETSFEGLVGKLEHGEDSVYGMITNDKDIIFTPKIPPISEKDLKEIPGLKELVDSIKEIEELVKRTPPGKKRFNLKKQLIEMRKDQYVLRSTFKKHVNCMNGIKGMPKVDLSETITIDEKGEVHSTGVINLYDPRHVSALLCHYATLKEDLYAKFTSDAYYLMIDLEDLIDKYIKDKYPIYFKILVYKIDGLQNSQIKDLLKEEFNTTYSQEYISHLWRQKIPTIIAEAAADEYLNWYYSTQEKGKWKICSKCGQKKLINSRFFSKNKSSRDGFYSICKECRKIKYQEKKISKGE